MALVVSVMVASFQLEVEGDGIYGKLFDTEKED